MFRFFSLFAFVLLSTACTKTKILDPETEESNSRKAQKVAYYTPVYAQPNEGLLKVQVTPPKAYTKTGKIITYENYIFINEPLEGIHVVDNSNPEAPENIAFITVKGNIDMTIVDGFLYADMFSALIVLDIRELLNAQLIEDFTVDQVFDYDPYWAFEYDEETQAYEYVRIDSVDHSKGIVVDWEIEIRWEYINDKIDFGIWLGAMRYDDTNAALDAVTEASGVPNISQAGSLTRFLPVDGALYALNRWELILFKINEQHQPERFGKTNTEVNAETLFRLNDLMFIGATSGMQMYDISDPFNPKFLNQINHFRSCDPVVADDTYAYVTLRGGTNCFTTDNELQIIRIDNPQELKVVGRQLLFNPHGLAVYGDHVLVCDGTAGIKVVDVSDRNQPKVLETYPIPFAYDVILNYPSAVVIGEGKLYQYDLSELPKLILISEKDAKTAVR